MHFELCAYPEFDTEGAMSFSIPAMTHNSVKDIATVIALPGVDAELENIAVNPCNGPPCGRGTVLLRAAVAWAQETTGSSLMVGTFMPDENQELRIAEWYRRRHLYVEGSQLIGYIHDIISACDEIMMQRGLTYAIQWSISTPRGGI